MSPVPTKGSPEAKAKMAAARAARVVKQPPQDNAHVAPGAEQFQEPAVDSNEVLRYGQQTKITADVTSMVEEIKEDSIVDIFNPLNQAFEVTFAISALEPVRLTAAQLDANRKAGIDAKDGGGVGHAVRTTVLPAQKVTRLPGVAAQRAVYQLRNYLMGEAGHQQRLADSVLKREYEQQIIIRIGSTFDQIGAVDPQVEMDKKIAELNQTTPQQVTQTGAVNESTFPGLGLNPEAPSITGQPSVAS